MALLTIPRSMRARLSSPRAPLVLLGLLCVVAVGVRAYRLTTPVAKPPDQGYIFDERYYVSAARVIAGEHVTRGDVYFHAAPKGADPNGEHPQLGKVVIAGSIELFGDNAIGWRISAIVFGLAAILLLYWLVRCAGGSSWLALGTAALATFDNLWVVHSRIAVLDIYVVPFMLAGAGLYLKRRPVLAGLVIGVGCCIKEFAVYAVLVLLLLELMRLVAWGAQRRQLRRDAAGAGGEAAPAGAASAERVRAAPAPAPPVRRGAALRRLAPAVGVCVVAGITYFSLLSLLDTAFPPYSGGARVDRHQAHICRYTLIWRTGCNHFSFMNHYAATLTDRGRPRGIASAPTDWWLNRKVITYYGTSVVVKSGKVVKSERQILAFKGEISRVLLYTSWLAFLVCAWWAIRRRDELSMLAIAWAIGTWLPPELFHLVDHRTTYLYYMVVTMPALYMAVARLLGARRVPWILVAAWAVGFLWDFAALYPFREAISL